MSFTWHVTSLLNHYWIITVQVLQPVLTSYIGLIPRYSHVSIKCVRARIFIYTLQPYRQNITGTKIRGFFSAPILFPLVVQLVSNRFIDYFLTFGLLAPYLERACFLFATPAVSRVPLMMWYLVPGRSLTRPPRIRTTECS